MDFRKKQCKSLMLIKHIKRLDGATHHDENIVDCLLDKCMKRRADCQLVAKFLAPSSRLKDLEGKKLIMFTELSQTIQSRFSKQSCYNPLSTV